MLVTCFMHGSSSVGCMQVCAEVLLRCDGASVVCCYFDVFPASIDCSCSVFKPHATSQSWHSSLTKHTVAVYNQCIAACILLRCVLHSCTVCLQSNQLRQLTQDSLDSYVAFFEQYREAGKSINKVKGPPCHPPNAPMLDDGYSSSIPSSTHAISRRL